MGNSEDYKAKKIGQHELHPETLMMGYGYSPRLSEGALKPPVFLTSTFVFQNSQAGKDFFDFVSGRRKPGPEEETGLIYSRFNNPNLEVLEDRLCLWEKADNCSVFASGMGAISTTLWTFLRPGGVILYSSPLYGGTETLIDRILPNFRIATVPFYDGIDRNQIDQAVQKALAQGEIQLILVETPANPTNRLVDLYYLKVIADKIGQQQKKRPPVAVDNTFLGPLYQHPLSLGADMVMYSLTKYVGGHSDLVAGAVLGREELLTPIRQMRSTLGTQLDPNSAWMLLRSLETLAIRMERSNQNAEIIANYLHSHPKVSKVNYLGFLSEKDPSFAIFKQQCLAAGSTFSFHIKGGEKEAFKMLDSLKVLKLAVSLGGTETLISHPASTTHSGVPKETRDRQGVTDSMIRISVGIENSQDLIADLDNALGII